MENITLTAEQVYDIISEYIDNEPVNTFESADKVWQVEAYSLDCIGVKGLYLIKCQNNSVSYFDIENNCNDLDWYLVNLHRDLDQADRIVALANIYGVDSDQVPDCLPFGSGKYRLLVTGYYTDGSEASDWLRDEKFEPVEFETFDEALEWIENESEKVHFLRHDEASAPSYKIIEV